MTSFAAPQIGGGSRKSSPLWAVQQPLWMEEGKNLLNGVPKEPELPLAVTAGNILHRTLFAHSRASDGRVVSSHKPHFNVFLFLKQLYFTFQLLFPLPPSLTPPTFPHPLIHSSEKVRPSIGSPMQVFHLSAHSLWAPTSSSQHLGGFPYHELDTS